MTLNKVLIFGHGQLGQFYKNYFEDRGVKIDAPHIDIRDEEIVLKVIKDAQPDVVINVAAKTNIDWCEQNKLEAFHINALGAENIGKACAELGVYLVHLSSGCVQESKIAEEVWSEKDPVGPICYYSWTKVWAENLLNDLAKRNNLKAVILRPRQLLSSIVSPRNAVTKLLTYNKFVDTANSCTIVEDLMWVTEELIKREVAGTYNVVNRGVITPFQIAELLKELVKPDMIIEKISKEELNVTTLAKRVDCVLSTDKLNSLGIELKEIRLRLREILYDFKQDLNSSKANEVMNRTERETRDKLSLVEHL